MHILKLEVSLSSSTIHLKQMNYQVFLNLLFGLYDFPSLQNLPVVV